MPKAISTFWRIYLIYICTFFPFLNLSALTTFPFAQHFLGLAYSGDEERWEGKRCPQHDSKSAAE
jgi:hypothetical protein